MVLIEGCLKNKKIEKKGISCPLFGKLVSNKINLTVDSTIEIIFELGVIGILSLYYFTYLWSEPFKINVIFLNVIFLNFTSIELSSTKQLTHKGVWSLT